MKTLLTILLMLFVSFSQAQTAEEINELAQAQIAAEELCECLNSFLKELHPKFVVLLSENAELGNSKAEENFFSYFENASTEEKLKIQEDFEKFDEIDSIFDQRCENAVKIIEQNNNLAFFEAIKNNLNNKQECELVSTIFNSIDMSHCEE
jgi:hypothetical protein